MTDGPIVYIASSIIPSRAANSVHVMRMCQALAATAGTSGQEVVLLVPDRPGRDGVVEDAYNHYGVDRSFRIEWLRWPSVPGKGYIFAVLAARRAAQLRPSLVYTRHLVSAVFTTGWGLPTVFESHAPVDEGSRLQGWLFSRMLKGDALRRIVVISDALAGYYKAHFPAAKAKLLVAHDGADPVELPANPVRDGFHVGYVGQLYPGRGIEQIAGMIDRCPDMHFHIVGGVEQDIRIWRDRLSGFGNATVHGYLVPAKAREVLGNFDVVLAPYQRQVRVFGGRGDTSQWMSPLKIFEYMAAGRAIVCSDMPVLREVLRDGENALLCKPDDVDKWVSALARLRDNPDLARSFGATAKADFLRHYTWQARADAVVSGLI